jgi:hypothetical protein
VDSFGIGNVHQTWHQLNGLELPNSLREQSNRLFRLVPEKYMRVFIDNVNNLSILHILQVLQSFLIGFLGQIVHNNHLKIILFIGKINQVLYSPMRLHYQVD